MVRILGTGELADGQKYVMIDKADWEELDVTRMLFELMKKLDPEEYAEELKSAMREVEREGLLQEVEVPDDLRKEWGHLLERNPLAVKYLRAVKTMGRPEALTSPQRAFIAENTQKTGKELYELLRANMGYLGSLKTVQNELARARKSNDEELFELF